MSTLATVLLLAGLSSTATASDVEHEARGVFRHGGMWYADAQEIWKGLHLIMLSENFMHGEGTHWIETWPALVPR